MGTVLDNASHAVAGAKISLIQQTSAVAVFTDPNGTFVLNNIKPGSYRAIASKAGYDTSLQNLNLNSVGRASVQFRLNQQNSPVVASLLRSRMNGRAVIRGRVLDKNGRGIANATVALKPIAGNSALATIMTNQNGEYQFNIGAGQYEVRVSRDSYQAASHVIDAKAGATTQTDFALKPAAMVTGRTQGSQTSITSLNKVVRTGSVVGQVLDAKTGRAVAGAIVSMSGQQRMPTSPTGNFAFANLSPGSYQLIIVNTGYLSIQRVVSIVPGETIRLSFALTPQSSAPVRIRRP